MRLEIQDSENRVTVGHLEFDEQAGACAFIDGPPGLEDLVKATLSKGVFRLASEREGDVYLSFTKRVEPDDDRLHKALFMRLAGNGFYAPELEIIVKQQMQTRREAVQNAAQT